MCAELIRCVSNLVAVHLKWHYISFGDEEIYTAKTHCLSKACSNIYFLVSAAHVLDAVGGVTLAGSWRGLSSDRGEETDMAVRNTTFMSGLAIYLLI